MIFRLLWSLLMMWSVGQIHGACDFTESSTFKGRFGVVTTDNAICSDIGSAIMQEPGSSAVDAFIATAFCMGVAMPQATSIGAGFMMTILNMPDNDGKKGFKSLIARERAPSAATPNMYSSASSTVGGMAVGVPGELAGLASAHDKYGKLSWSDLVAPSILLCENGFPVGPILAEHISRRTECLSNPNTELCKMISHPNGTRLVEGDVMTRPKLALTLRSIADNKYAMYESPMADVVAGEIQEAGGIITSDDLKDYKVTWTDTLQADVVSSDGETWTMHGPPPPSSSAILFAIIKCLDKYGLKLEDLDDPDKEVLYLHRFVECSKFSFGLRALLGDNETRGADQVNLLKLLQSDSLANTLKSKISDAYVLPYADYNLYNSSIDVPPDHGTTHIVVWHKNQVVSSTHTINLTFGSRVVGKTTGIAYNNQQDDFSTIGTVNNFGYSFAAANMIEPGKRPMSSTIPLIVVDSKGQPRLATGCSGGSRIISSVARIVDAVLMGTDVDEATDLKRLHHQLSPNVINHEPGYPSSTVTAELKLKGQTFAVRGLEFTVCQSVQDTCDHSNASPDSMCLLGVSDRRRCGRPAGY